MDQFFNWLNSLHETISFTFERDAHHVNFLDTTVYHNCNHELCVKPFVKPTDRNTYLHFRSFHTRQLRTNIPYGQFLHLKRNATNNEDFVHHAVRLQQQFTQRGYPKEVVLDAEVRATLRSRESLFKRSSVDHNLVRIHWALDHLPRSMTISRIIRKHWHLVSDVPGCESPPQIGYRRTRSLRSILIHADVSLKENCATTDILGHHKSGQCKICPLTTSSKEIHFPDKGFSHKLSSFSDCKTCFCVYLLVCFCGKKYIGSTKRQLRVRILEHVSHIKNKVIES